MGAGITRWDRKRLPTGPSLAMPDAPFWSSLIYSILRFMTPYPVKDEAEIAPEQGNYDPEMSPAGKERREWRDGGEKGRIGGFPE